MLSSTNLHRLERKGSVRRPPFSSSPIKLVTLIRVQSTWSQLHELHLGSRLLQTSLTSSIVMMTQDSALELLSPELQQQILLQLACLDTLHALIRACPRLYKVFRLNKEVVLSAVTLHQFHPAVQPEALAIAHLEQYKHDSKRTTAHSFCDNFPNHIHRWCESHTSKPMSIDLCRLDGTIKYFIEDYARNTLPVLGQLGQSQDLAILPEYRLWNHIADAQLSSTEFGRLQRAFCRFELYRRLFSRCSQDYRHGIHECIIFPPITVAEQAKMFLRDLPSYQIEEIACIRDYLFRRLRGVYDVLENNAVVSLPVKAMTFEHDDESAMARSPFFMFTAHVQQEQENHLEHLLSLGLPYIRRILDLSGNEQRDMFLHHIDCGHTVGHLETDFLSEALRSLGLNPNFVDDYSVFLNMGKGFAPAHDENGYSELPQGWLWGHYHREPYKLAADRTKGLRDWGYVFWDYDRLEKSGMLRREWVTTTLL